VFFLQLSVVGSTMGTRTELAALLRFLVTSGIRPEIDRVYPLADAREACERLESGEQFGKIVLRP
jgi:D-arabinose 1-dehydrogenase-like Zn-dependent alcohol dehydrogenase